MYFVSNPHFWYTPWRWKMVYDTGIFWPCNPHKDEKQPSGDICRHRLLSGILSISLVCVRNARYANLYPMINIEKGKTRIYEMNQTIEHCLYFGFCEFMNKMANYNCSFRLNVHLNTDQCLQCLQLAALYNATLFTFYTTIYMFVLWSCIEC